MSHDRPLAGTLPSSASLACPAKEMVSPTFLVREGSGESMTGMGGGFPVGGSGGGGGSLPSQVSLASAQSRGLSRLRHLNRAPSYPAGYRVPLLKAIPEMEPSYTAAVTRHGLAVVPVAEPGRRDGGGFVVQAGAQ